MSIWSRLRRREPAPPDLSCQELVELITAYLDDALSADDRARFERHLGGCPACTEFLAQFQATRGALARFTERDLEPAARDAMLQTFRAWRAGT